MNIETIVYAQEDLHMVVNHIMPLLPKVSVVTLEGPLGAGKTTLVQALLQALGVHEHITSPTFAYVQTYKGKDEMILHHFDLYRITTVDAFIEAGFDEYLAQHNACSFIEWPQVIAPLLEHMSVLHLTLDYEGIDMRTLTIRLQLKNK